ncbi:MAG: D-alanyl-D-alanine carboxypeptidase family protein [Bdellovibrionales bacterium]|nr:D-alanyl-D-alanine carboxypeptidase family protein [Bdellovibrionales bacterium]
MKPKFINVGETFSDFKVYLPYATEDNFVRKKVYSSHQAFVHEVMIESLGEIQERLKETPYQLLILDAYRPFSIQEYFWSLCPDEGYLAKPIRDDQRNIVKGSNHNRGLAIDCTLTNRASESWMPMPSGFDEFNEKAHRVWTNQKKKFLQDENYKYAIELEEILEGQGFRGNPREWWHFDFVTHLEIDYVDLSFEELIS